MLTDSGKLTAKELLMRVAIALVGFAAVMATTSYVFDQGMRDSIVQLRSALQQVKQQQQKQAQQQDREEIDKALNGQGGDGDSGQDVAFAKWWQPPTECLQPADEQVFARCVELKQTKRAEFDALQSEGKIESSQ